MQLEFFFGGTKYSGLSHFDLPQYTQVNSEMGHPMPTREVGSGTNYRGLAVRKGAYGSNVLCLLIFSQSAHAGVTRK